MDLERLRGRFVEGEWDRAGEAGSSSESAIYSACADLESN